MTRCLKALKWDHLTKLCFPSGGKFCLPLALEEVNTDWYNIVSNDLIFIYTGFLVWGLVYSIQAPFYTNEALKRGANLSQVEFDLASVQSNEKRFAKYS